MLIQSLHPSNSSPRPTVSVVASEILRHWPLSNARHHERTLFLIVYGPDARIPWHVSATGKGLDDSQPYQRIACATYPYPPNNAEPSRHRAKRMAVQLLKALK